MLWWNWILKRRGKPERPRYGKANGWEWWPLTKEIDLVSAPDGAWQLSFTLELMDGSAVCVSATLDPADAARLLERLARAMPERIRLAAGL